MATAEMEGVMAEEQAAKTVAVETAEAKAEKA